MRNKSLAVAAVLALSVGTSTGATVLSHRYTFDDGTANDSVGTANGSLVSTATISGGQLVTTGSGNGPTGQGVSLPASAVTGINGDYSVEQWFTRSDTNANWQVLSSFDQETSDTNNYLLVQVERADSTQTISSATAVAGTANVLTGPKVLDLNQHQIVTTYVASTSTLSIYVDGALGGSQIIPAFNLSAQSAYIGINNGSPYGDPTFNGSTNDFDIFNGALSSSQVSSLFGLGADPTNAQINAAVPEPASGVMLAVMGMGLLLKRRRRV
ncbi:MAG TPA: LamG-like jellyroll fold domain-containing protein [Tepidisphaeraceae bacterium]|nr:LamG-like jellyroll fold domain-containing protein [Tepidisphaeraceae bacterium]